MWALEIRGQGRPQGGDLTLRFSLIPKNLTPRKASLYLVSTKEVKIIKLPKFDNLFRQYDTLAKTLSGMTTGRLPRFPAKMTLVHAWAPLELKSHPRSRERIRILRSHIIVRITVNGVFRCFQAYRLEPLICGDYSNIPPVQLHRFDSKQAGYTEAKPSKTGQAAGKWGGLFRVGFSRQKTEEADASSNGEENMDEDDVVVVHNAASADKSIGKLFFIDLWMRAGRCLPNTYHLHEKSGNSAWKIKWFASFRLGSFRKLGLWFEVMQFFYSF